jgi:small redox-active disulfide protein 2
LLLNPHEKEVIMINIKVLGPGCSNCRHTYALIEEVAKAKGVDIELEKIEDIKAIMTFGVMSTPGVVIDDKVVHAGGIPPKSKIESWF